MLAVGCGGGGGDGICEDIDLCLRIRDHGYRVWYWPEIDVIHVGGGSNVAGKRPPEANVAYFRTMGPFYRKHRPGLSGRVTAFIITAVAECMLFASKLGLRRLSPHTKPVENDGG